MEALVHGCQWVLVLYVVGQVITLLGIVAYASGNPGVLRVIASLMDAEPPRDITERAFLLVFALTASLQWPLLLVAFLDRNGPWRG